MSGKEQIFSPLSSLYLSQSELLISRQCVGAFAKPNAWLRGHGGTAEARVDSAAVSGHCAGHREGRAASGPTGAPLCTRPGPRARAQVLSLQVAHYSGGHRLIAGHKENKA